MIRAHVQSKSFGATIPLPRTFVLGQASTSIACKEVRELRKVDTDGEMYGQFPPPIRVIDSLRHIGRSRQYAAHGRDAKRRLHLPPGGAVSLPTARNRTEDLNVTVR
jgi:hypothetical protein